MRRMVLLVSILALLALPASGAPAAEKEIRQYKGVGLAPFDRDYDNSIEGPQKVGKASYRLKVDGLVKKSLSLSYQEILALPQVDRVITLNCVEGWSERLLFSGARLEEVLAKAGVKGRAKWVVFHAADGYSTALPLAYLRASDALLAYRINARTLDAKRGFPLQLVAEKKFGYKWAKWITRIELREKEYLGFWERRGYDNQADIK